MANVEDSLQSADRNRQAQPNGLGASSALSLLLQRLIGACGYFFAGIGIALCAFLALSLAFYSPELLPYLFVWANGKGLGGVFLFLCALVLVALGAAIGRRLATGRNL